MTASPAVTTTRRACPAGHSLAATLRSATATRRRRSQTRTRIEKSRAPGPGRGFFLGSVVLLELLRVAMRQEGLLVRRVPALDLAAALELGVQLGAEQHGDVRDPQPGEEDD